MTSNDIPVSCLNSLDWDYYVFSPTPPEQGKLDVLGLEGRKCVTLKESCNWKDVRGRGLQFADLGKGKFMCRGQEGARDLYFLFLFFNQKRVTTVAQRVTCGICQNSILSITNLLKEQFPYFSVHQKLILINFLQML